MTKNNRQSLQGLIALSPLIVFLCLYLVTSLVVNDFYAMPITVAFAASSVYAVAITRGMPLRKRIECFSSGAAHSNLMLMIWIFILAGAFAKSAEVMGAVDSTVGLILMVLPDSLVAAGLFVGACFVSLAIGTSVGTIVAMVPVAAGIASATGADAAFMTAIIVGGAFFGDNLSFISDTTIAATRTQGCSMSDKFRTNLRIVLPAALAVMVFYLLCGSDMNTADVLSDNISPVKVLPYIVVLVTAIMGVDVTVVLVLGILTTGIVGLCTDSLGGMLGWVLAMGDGIMGMGELIVVTLLAGGMLELIRVNGGIDLILRALTRGVRGRRGGELAIAALVSLANVCTANNTIAIITVGPIAADVSRRYGVDPRKSASILDTFSCVVQGVIPYGAQLLMAASLSALSPLAIIGKLYYPLAVLVCALLGILIKSPRRK